MPLDDALARAADVERVLARRGEVLSLDTPHGREVDIDDVIAVASRFLQQRTAEKVAYPHGD